MIIGAPLPFLLFHETVVERDAASSAHVCLTYNRLVTYSSSASTSTVRTRNVVSKVGTLRYVLREPHSQVHYTLWTGRRPRASCG